MNLRMEKGFPVSQKGTIHKRKRKGLNTYIVFVVVAAVAKKRVLAVLAKFVVFSHLYNIIINLF